MLNQVTIQPEEDILVSGYLSGRMDISTIAIEHAPRILGFADPIRYLQSLPGVQTTSELQGGLFIDGTDSSHTLVTLGNAPVYNPSHLLGIFSMFNTLHFSEMSLSKQAPGTIGRLGGLVELRSDTTHTEHVQIKSDIGIIGSQANIHIPVSDKSTLSVSSRFIYFNFISDHYLTKFWKDNTLGYKFNDHNVTWSSRLKCGDLLQVNYFNGSDKATFNVIGNNLQMAMNWNNSVFSGNWEHMTNKNRITQSIYRSSYFCRFNALMDSRNMYLPGGLTDYSYKLDGHNILYDGIFRYGIRLSHYKFEIQNPTLTQDIQTSSHLDYDIGSDNACANVMYCRNITDNNILELSLTGNIFSSTSSNNWSGKIFAGVDPSVSITHTFPGNNSNLGVKIRNIHQYLHICGFTTNGMPTEFWLPSGRNINPESSASISANYERKIFDGRINLQSEIYFKTLRGTIELDNSIIQAINENYSLWNNIFQGNGYAYGVNLMIGNSEGAFDWLVSYSYGRSYTKSDRFPSYSPCYFERPHDLKLRLNWEMNPKWRFSADGMICSGTPFTLPEYAYVINENVFIEYGEHNNARMPANWRVDLSAGWTISQTEEMSCGLDFALYNAFCAHNVLYYYFHRRTNNDTYLLKRFMPMPICLPSVSLHFNY